MIWATLVAIDVIYIFSSILLIAGSSNHNFDTQLISNKTSFIQQQIWLRPMTFKIFSNATSRWLWEKSEILTFFTDYSVLGTKQNQEVVVAPLAKRLLSVSVVHGSIPVIGFILYRPCVKCCLMKRQQDNKERPRITPFKRITF